MTGSPYNINPELVEMKEDIAKRKQGMMVKSMLITGVFLAIGIAVGLAVLPALLPEMFAAGAFMSAYAGGMLGFVAGGAAANFFTLKEKERLKIDEQYVESYNQGKNHWGKGYREEVAEHGYSLAGPVAGLPPHVGKDIANQR